MKLMLCQYILYKPTSRIFPIGIGPCMPLYSLTCVQKGYMVHHLANGS